MDSNQEAANLAQIENVRLSRTMLKLMWASLAVSAICAIFAAWPLLRPSNASQAAPPAGGDSMLSWMWIPAIVLGASSLVLTATLLIVAFKQWRYKRLAKNTAQLQSDLTKTQTELEHERGKPKFVLDTSKVESLNAELNTARETIKRLEETHKLALTAANIEKNAAKEDLETAKREKAKLAQDLANEKSLHESLKVSMDISRREVAETKANANAQTSTYELTFKGMSQELNEAKLELEQAKLTINQETTQREEFTRLYNEATHDLAIWKPIIKQAKDQAAQIDEWVRMKEAIPGKLLLRRDRMVTLEIRIRNESLYPISIRPQDIKGRLRFKAVSLREEIQTLPDEPSIRDLEPKGTALIKLQQPLRGFEAERIQESREGGDNDGLFWLGDLYIPISAKNTPVPVRALPLVIIPEHISLDVHAFSYNK